MKVTDVLPRGLPSSRSVTAGGVASIALVCVAALVLLFLLNRTEQNAVAIRRAAADIASSGRGINENTDSILQLNKTNQLATSILSSAQPLDDELAQINHLAGGIDARVGGIQQNAASIDSSARSINSSASTIAGDVTRVNALAATINSSAGGINTSAGRIVEAAGAIERGIRFINGNAASAASVVRAILSDAKGIDVTAVRANHLAHCIDHGLNGGSRC